MRSVHKREETKEEKVGFKPRMEKHYERLTVSLGSEHEDKGVQTDAHYTMMLNLFVCRQIFAVQNAARFTLFRSDPGGESL